MNQKIKIAIIIGVIISIFIISILCYEIFKTSPAAINETNTFIDSNKSIDNMINNLFENDITSNNETQENQNIVENKIENNINTSKTENTQDNLNANTQTTTSKEEKALKIAKNDWGEDSTVYFSNSGIDKNGKYIVEVHDSTTTETLTWYIIDISTEKFYKQ